MQARIGVFILWLIHFLPFRLIVAIGNGLGLLLCSCVSARRRIGEINLKLCFPEMSDAERARLLRAHFKLFMRALVERCLLWWSGTARINALIRVGGARAL